MGVGMVFSPQRIKDVSETGGMRWRCMRCNFRCRHCYMSAPHAKLGELSHDVLMQVVEQIAACGIPAVSLTGGEPLLRKVFFEIVDALRAHGTAVTQQN